MYGELRLLEVELTGSRGTGCDAGEMVARLDRLEEQANHLKVPVAYSSMLYELRNSYRSRARRVEEARC